MSLSSSSSLLATGSAESIKIWDLESLQCTKNFESGYITSLIFLPKDRFFLIGEKNGMLRLFDLNRNEQVQEIQGHEDSIWSIALHEKPNGWDNIVILTGGADKKIKFWELVVGEKKGSILLHG
jgi:U3 small nucleolar RNA-associated protein 12